MFKYDIPYPKDGQLTLTLNGLPINVSKRRSYLIDKMLAHRASICNEDPSCPAAEYKIIGADNSLVFSRSFADGEMAFSKNPYHKATKDPTNYVSKNGFKLIADANGNIITDEKCLTLLHDFIYIKRLPIPNSRQVAVQLATYKPLTKNEFISLKGLGEKMYDKCGEILLNAIKVYLEHFP